MAPLQVDPPSYLNFHHPAGRCLSESMISRHTGNQSAMATAAGMGADCEARPAAPASRAHWAASSSTRSRMPTKRWISVKEL